MKIPEEFPEEFSLFRKPEVFKQMKNNNNNLGIVELIDRTLNKGVIVNADLVITVAEVPLLAANIRLALASVETMLKYGMMNDLLKPKPLITELKPGLLIKEESKKEIDIGMKEGGREISESYLEETGH